MEACAGGGDGECTLTSTVEPKATSKRHSRHLPISWVFSGGGSWDWESEGWVEKLGKDWPTLMSASWRPGTDIGVVVGGVMWEL